MLSNTCKYAIRALIYLTLFSTPEKKVGIKEVSKSLEIPTPFLGKILQVLAKKGILHSTKGPHGGFYLNRSALEISVMEVIEIIDGNQLFDTCVIRTTLCSSTESCSLHGKVAPRREEMKTVFETQTVADLASEFRQGKERIRI